MLDMTTFNVSEARKDRKSSYGPFLSTKIQTNTFRLDFLLAGRTSTVEFQMSGCFPTNQKLTGLMEESGEHTYEYILLHNFETFLSLHLNVLYQ